MFMGRNEAFKQKIMQTPTATDIKPSRLQSFLEYYGFVLKRSNGSHFFYEYKNDEVGCCHRFPIPMHDPINPAYIDKIREIIIEVEGEGE